MSVRLNWIDEIKSIMKINFQVSLNDFRVTDRIDHIIRTAMGAHVA